MFLGNDLGQWLPITQARFCDAKNHRKVATEGPLLIMLSLISSVICLKFATKLAPLLYGQSSLSDEQNLYFLLKLLWTCLANFPHSGLAVPFHTPVLPLKACPNVADSLLQKPSPLCEMYPGKTVNRDLMESVSWMTMPKLIGRIKWWIEGALYFVHLLFYLFKYSSGLEHWEYIPLKMFPQCAGFIHNTGLGFLGYALQV